jgi:hypothetical protein
MFWEPVEEALLSKLELLVVVLLPLPELLEESSDSASEES